MQLRQRESGFVLADLGISGIIGVLIAGIIAILIGLIASPIQQVREASNLYGDVALGKLGAIETTLLLRRHADRFARQFGRTPISVAEIAAACSAQVPGSIWDDTDITHVLNSDTCVRVQDGVDGGFIYFWDAANGRMEGWPAAPGLTAANTVVTFDGVTHELLETPGADAARASAFADLRARAGDVIGALLSVESNQPLVIRDTGLNVATGDVCGDILGDIVTGYADADGNGTIDGNELTSASSLVIHGLGGDDAVESARSALAPALAIVAEVFAYGAGDEDVASFGIDVANLAACGAPTLRSVYYNYTNLEFLTRAYVTDDNIEGRLIRLLRDARRSAAMGNVAGEQEALQAYLDRVEERGVFEWITRNHQVALAVTAQATASQGVTLQ